MAGNSFHCLSITLPFTHTEMCQAGRDTGHSSLSIFSLHYRSVQPQNQEASEHKCVRARLNDGSLRNLGDLFRRV